MSKPTFIVLMSLLFGWGCGFAQTEQGGSGEANNSLRDGAWALQFGISEDFTLRDFQGAVISLKHHRSPKSAFRLGLNLRFNEADADQSRSVTANDTVTVYPQVTSSTSRQDVEIDLQYMRYPNPGARMNLYVAAGPLFGYGRDYAENTGISVNSDRLNRSWNLGLIAQLGVEWFPMKSLSLHAEYGVRGEYYWNEIRDRRRSKESYEVVTRTNDGWDFQPHWVLFGLSAYF